MEYLELGDFLLIAEQVLGVPADSLARLDRISLADSALHAPRAGFGGVELYPSVNRKAAVLCSRLIRNHPLPDGNKRVAYLCMLEFLERNGHDTSGLAARTDETVNVIEAVAAGALDEHTLTLWIAARLRYP